ncbi:putative 5-amino-6-(5-phospho-D-ribitylamino)uracil phosphatase, chloroplastic [Cocos nucifera]|uniref:Putative 5-amino-6-(5-phospho-D-ribitylamino)uracil phosphatase, chloroplastic n=1 Tax=Cocos nucifera TaxID=13894 RepID=A0A8K0N0R0_COCNU|nr:putative 5-amino-6-(5-phospho-D-ribitylamino)uracil phosphatase, chloroplastic [Cocos nucifera]
MVGLPYDFLANPLGAVRLSFEKAVAAARPDVDPPAAFRGKDWGAVDLFRDFLFEQGGLCQVPILDASTIRWIQPNTLVRLRGMVQDMLGNEFYIGAYKKEDEYLCHPSHSSEELVNHGCVLQQSNLVNFDASSLSCLLKVYDMPESHIKLNDVLEFIGIYTFDPDLAIGKDDSDDLMDDLMEDVMVHLPSSKLRARVDVVTVGKLSLNLTSFTRESASVFGNQLTAAIQMLLPFTHAIPLTVEYLNTATLKPRKNNQTGRLVAGVLQLAEGTHLTLDETHMQAGVLDSNGVENARLLKHLMEWQTVEYDFEYYKLEMAADVQLLILSEGKSNILPADLVLPFRPTAVAAAVNPSAEDLQAWRWYLATSKSLPHSSEPEMHQLLQDELVAAMREDRSVGCTDLNRLLTMAQLMSASFGEKTLSLEHWQLVKELERLRKERLKETGWSNQRPESFREKCKDQTLLEINRIGFDTWKNMSPDERRQYVIQAEKVNVAYEKILLKESENLSKVDDEADSAMVGKIDMATRSRLPAPKAEIRGFHELLLPFLFSFPVPMDCAFRSSSWVPPSPALRLGPSYFLPKLRFAEKLKPSSVRKRLVVSRASGSEEQDSGNGFSTALSKVFVEETIGAEYGEGFETFRMDGPLKVDVDYLNDKLQECFLQRIRHAMKPDEAFGLIFSWDNVVVLCWTEKENELERLKSRLSQLYYENLLKIETPVEGLKEWLDAIYTVGIPTAVVSCLDRKDMVEALQRMGLSKYFQAIVSEEDGMESIAHRFLSAAVKLDRKPSKCIVFEDDPRGITAAHNCTMMAVALIGAHPAYELVQADLAVASFSELSVINLRRLFAHKGLSFMDLQKQIIEKSPPKRKLMTDTIF